MSVQYNLPRKPDQIQPLTNPVQRFDAPTRKFPHPGHIQFQFIRINYKTTRFGEISQISKIKHEVQLREEIHLNQLEGKNPPQLVRESRAQNIPTPFRSSSHYA